MIIQEKLIQLFPIFCTFTGITSTRRIDKTIKYLTNFLKRDIYLDMDRIYSLDDSPRRVYEFRHSRYNHTRYAVIFQ